MSDYRTVYNSYLLDELHNYFPAVLYEPESFRTVADLMNYVQLQMRLRFDLYSNSARSYRRAQGLPPISLPAASAPPVGPQRVPIPATPLRAAVPAPQAAPRVPPVEEVNIRMETTGGGGSASSTLNLLSSLLGIPPIAPTSGTHTVFDTTFNTALSTLLSGLPTTALFPLGGTAPLAAGPPPSMEPVIVRPTAAQIDAGTTIEIVDAEEEVCAICQDAMEAGSQARNLNACDHRFHVICIDTWFQRNVRCPVCRHDVREPAESDTESDGNDRYGVTQMLRLGLGREPHTGGGGAPNA
jgi:hypothetical protein